MEPVAILVYIPTAVHYIWAHVKVHIRLTTDKGLEVCLWPLDSYS